MALDGAGPFDHNTGHINKWDPVAVEQEVTRSVAMSGSPLGPGFSLSAGGGRFLGLIRLRSTSMRLV